MKKKLCSVLLAASLLLALSACKSEYHIPEDSYPTLPSFPEEKTPLQQLEAAFAATAAAGSRTVHYGTVCGTGEEATEDMHVQTVSEARPFDREALYAAAAYFPDNDNFLSDFCSQSIQAIPSNTGIIRYQLTGLSWEDASCLLFAQPHGDELDQALCAVSIDLDAQGRFCRLEVTVETGDSLNTTFLSITFSDSQ